MSCLQNIVPRRAWMVLVAAVAAFLSLPNYAWAAEGGSKTYWMVYPAWLLAFAASIAALVFAWRFFKSMMEADEGTEEMRDIAAAVRKGANAYLYQQYKVVFYFFLVICALLSIMAYMGAQSWFVPVAFLTGGFLYGQAGWCGMKKR